MLQLTHSDYTPLYVDFLSAKQQYRKGQGGGAKQMIAKAVGVRNKPSILDVTAGLGADAYVLASLGLEVKMCERQPTVFALLKDGLRRLKEVHALINLSLVSNDGFAYLLGLDESNYPDVIYLDPMHPPRKKSAQVKKEMQVLQQLVGSDDDKQILFEQALKCAQNRVVVKWPVKVEPISNKKADMIFIGKSTVYHVYLTNKKNSNVSTVY